MSGKSKIEWTGATPVAGANGTPTQSQTIAATSDQSKNNLRVVKVNDFLTFVSSHKHLVQVVEVEDERLHERRFDRKSGTWLTKVEMRERNSAIVLSPEEAETSFPGSVGARAKLPGEQAQPAQQSITLANPSKKGANHELVIKARKRENNIPWWTRYYATYKDRLWESLRTMERRIAAYRKDPSVTTTKSEKGSRPKYLTQLEHKLLGTATNVHEALADIRAGHIEEAVQKLSDNLPTQDRIEEHLERGVKPTYANPDGRAGSAADELMTALANEPDRDVASKLLTEHLRAHASQFANGRIKIKAVTARIEFAGRDERIMPGDWLEKKEKDAAPTLCKCVGVAEFMKRRKVQGWSDGKWGKERVVFSGAETNYRVVTAESARLLTPEAFSPADATRTQSEGL